MSNARTLASLTNSLDIDSNGNVGVNEATPLAQLHVKSSGSPEPALYLANTNADIAWPTIDNFQLGQWDGTTFTEQMRVWSGGALGLADGNNFSRIRPKHTHYANQK
jgi:hypothetical protein